MTPRRVLPLPTRPQETLEGYGTVVSVEIRYAGSELIGDHTSGASALQVQDVKGIPAQGVVNVGGVIVGGALVDGDELAYDGTDDLTDPDTTANEETILLTAATVNAYDARTQVTLTPLAEYKIALVVLDQAPDITLTCLVDHKLEDNLDEGPRAPGAGEIVWVRRRRGEHVVTVETIKGRRKKVDGGYLDGAKPATPGAITTSWQQKPDDFASTAKPEFLGDGAITGNVTVQGAMQSGGNGQGTTGLRPSGFGTRKSSGQPVSVYSNSDEQLDTHGGRGLFEELVASGDTFLDNVVQIGQGTALKFRSTTIPPTVSPIGDEDWPAVDGDFSGYLPSQRLGLAMVSDSEAYELAQNGLDTRVVGFDPSAGTALGIFTLSGGPSDVFRCSITYAPVADRLLTLGTDGTDWLVEAWALPSGDSCAYDAAATWAAPWTHGEHPGNPEGVMPALTCLEDTGQDRVVLAQTHRGDGKVNLAQYLDSVFDDQVTTALALNLGDIGGVAALSGGVDIVLASSQTAPGNPYRDADGNVAMPVVVMATGALTSMALPVGESNPACAGIACLDADAVTNRVWYASRSSNRIIQHSDPLAGGFLWLKGAWGDSGSGGLTLPGPYVKLTRRPGTRVGVVLSALPRGVDSGLLYAATGNTLPANANWHAQNAPLAAGPVFVQIFNIDTSGPNPVTVSTFPAGLETPAVLTSEDDSLVLDVASYDNPDDIDTRLANIEPGGDLYDLLAAGRLSEEFGPGLTAFDGFKRPDVANFAQFGEGYTLASGHMVTADGAVATGSIAAIVNGRQVWTDGTPGGVPIRSLGVKLGREPTMIMGRICISPETTTGTWSTAEFGANGVIGTATTSFATGSCQLDLAKWGLSLFVVPNPIVGPYPIYFSLPFTEPLVDDDTTEYPFYLFFDRPSTTVTVWFPARMAHPVSVTHPDFATYWGSRFCWQERRSATTDGRIAFTGIAAGSKGSPDSGIASALVLPYTQGTYVSCNPPQGYVPTDPQVDFWAAPTGGWVSGATQVIAALWNAAASHKCLTPVVASNGKPSAYLSVDGATTIGPIACSAVLPTNATGGRIRYDHTTGNLRFYYTTDPASSASPAYTELGTAGGTNAVSGGGLLYAPPRRTPMTVGTRDNSSSLMYGGLMSRMIWSDGGVTIADCDLRTIWYTSRKTDPVGNTWWIQGTGWSWQIPQSAITDLVANLATITANVATNTAAIATLNTEIGPLLQPSDDAFYAANGDIIVEARA